MKFSKKSSSLSAIYYYSLLCKHESYISGKREHDPISAFICQTADQNHPSYSLSSCSDLLRSNRRHRISAFYEVDFSFFLRFHRFSAGLSQLTRLIRRGLFEFSTLFLTNSLPTVFLLSSKSFVTKSRNYTTTPPRLLSNNLFPQNATTWNPPKNQTQ